MVSFTMTVSDLFKVIAKTEIVKTEWVWPI